MGIYFSFLPFFFLFLILTSLLLFVRLFLFFSGSSRTWPSFFTFRVRVFQVRKELDAKVLLLLLLCLILLVNGNYIEIVIAHFILIFIDKHIILTWTILVFFIILLYIFLVGAPSFPFRVIQFSNLD